MVQTSTQPISSPTPTIFAVDDDAVMCAMLRKLGESLGLPVETYSSAEQFLAGFQPDRPGCLVTDIHLGGISGMDLQQELLRRGATLPIIIITGKAKVPMAVKAIQNKAVDFLEKPFDAAVLSERIRHALKLDESRRASASKRADAAARLAKLTPREREVLQCVVQGMSNKQIAAHLHLSEKTVEVHRGHVMHKSGVESVAELVRLTIASQGA